MKQHSLIKNMVISNIPIVPNEEMKSIICKLFTLVKLELNFKRDVFYINRFGKITSNNTQPIIVYFFNTYTKVEFMTAFKQKKLTAKDLGIDFDIQIFVNHQLTPTNQLLMREARVLKKKLGYKYVWFGFRQGAVMVQVTENGSVKRIQQKSDFPQSTIVSSSSSSTLLSSSSSS